MVKAFSSPYVLKQRLGHDLDARELAGMDPDTLTELFARPPALHRFPKANAKRAQEMCQMLLAKYDGDPAKIWTDATTGAELVNRVGELPGFGKQKSQIFVALLGKQFGIQPPGWREATGVFGEHGSYRSVADITDEGSLAKVREYKQAQKAAAKAGG